MARAKTNKLEEYSKRQFATEIKEIQSSNRNKECPTLTTYEKALIFTYSNDGYRNINEDLRLSKGKDFSEFALYLDASLSKLPDFEGLVYRKVYLTRTELAVYQTAFYSKKSIKEYTFISTSKSRLTAMMFQGSSKFKPNCLFRMFCKTGKEIEKISKFDEKEVLIRPNKSFRILEMKMESDYNLITMEEI